jgi:hypothetical protein
LASTVSLTKIAFDASAIIGFDDPNIRMLEEIRKYFRASNHLMIICREIAQECLSVRPPLNDSDVCTIVSSGQTTFRDVKSMCNGPVPQISDNDYRCISTAVDEGCPYLVTNDAVLLEAAKYYATRKPVGLIVFTPANFLYYMHSSHKDLFSWKINIKTATKLFHHVEMENLVLGIQRKKWVLKQAKERFTPYATNIYQTIDKVT